ncbi:group 3 secretory phospholipase A2 isoform X2 [Heptranchias perlo]|uniref:group 3 secretory phospholipase A2 isoform X2 n=1 Tax=Heptranchias perlo TaxID=212740 RepID=UPI00355A3531
MFLGGCFLCLLYFPQMQVHAAWSRDRLAGLSQAYKSLCHLVASDPSARSLSFLARVGGLHGGLVLFQTTWSRQGHLEQCIVREEQTITSTYLAFCLEKRDSPPTAGRFLSAPDSRLEMDLRCLEERGVNCSSPLTSIADDGVRETPVSPGWFLRGRRSASSAPAGSLRTPRGAWFLQDAAAAAAAAVDRRKGARRSRRGWTVPGTIWCGAGDSAENFTDLGADSFLGYSSIGISSPLIVRPSASLDRIFDRTDFCCREHDHCEHKLSAFEYNYGMRNFRLHTISHCDCDYRFKRCLLNVNNTISTLVGITFFSILQIPCFVLEPVEHCVKRTWWSGCDVTERVPQAALRTQSKYNYTHSFLDEFQMELWTKPTGSPAATSRENQTASNISVGSTSLHSLPDTTQKIKGRSKKKCRKCNGRRRQKTKVPSQNILEMRPDMMSTVIPSRTDFNPGIEQNSMENSFPVVPEEKDVSRNLLQRNVSNSLMNQVSDTMAIGLDENAGHRYNGSEEPGFTILEESSMVTSLSESVDPTLSLSKNITMPLIGLDKNTYMVKNRVESSFSIPQGKKIILSRFSKNRGSESLPNHRDKKGLSPVDPARVSGNWSRPGIIGSCSFVPQSPDPIRHHRTRDKDNSRSCNCYKPLDQCEHKISPQEFKFSYYNQEPKTLYHCDCTKRLAKRMKRRVSVNTVEKLFSEFVSLSCFRLKSVKRSCSKEGRRLCEKHSSSTVAILSKPKHLRKILKIRRTVDESLYPLPDEQERNKNGTFLGTNSVKLYDKCLQMIRASTVKA